MDGLLALSRAEAGTSERRPVDVGEVIADRVEAWESLAAERDVTLAGPTIRLVRPQAPLVPGDLEQILDNLLANALDATPAGRGISVEMAETESSVTVSVVDGGPGMPDADRARAFDRFWQGPGHRGGSSGLGLAIVRQLARRNGAAVELGPATSQTAILQTPILQTPVPQTPTAQSPTPSTPTPSTPTPSTTSTMSPLTSPGGAGGGPGLRAVIRLER